MSEEKEQLEDFPGNPKWYETVWWTVKDFFSDWVYPAYKLKDLLFNRYDLVRLPGIGMTEYCDVVERMFLANMELIKFFVEKEHPAERIEWYGEHGHRYGEAEGIDVVYPEMKGKYIWDIVTEIYNWWRFDYPRLESERSYLLSFCCDYCWGELKSRKKDDEYSELVFDRSNCPKTLDDLEGNGIDWDVIDRYCDGDRKNVLVERFMSGKLDELERRIENEKQKYLHLCVEVRPYLWT